MGRISITFWHMQLRNKLMSQLDDILRGVISDPYSNASLVSLYESHKPQNPSVGYVSYYNSNPEFVEWQTPEIRGEPWWLEAMFTSVIENNRKSEANNLIETIYSLRFLDQLSSWEKRVSENLEDDLRRFSICGIRNIADEVYRHFFSPHFGKIFENTSVIAGFKTHKFGNPSDDVLARWNSIDHANKDYLPQIILTKISPRVFELQVYYPFRFEKNVKRLEFLQAPNVRRTGTGTFLEVV